MNPRPGPEPASDAGPVPGYSGDWWIEQNSTRGSAWKMSLVPLPWCTSQSTIITRSRPCASRACRAATATLLNRQKPIARSASAWCPGGRWIENPVGARPSISRSTSDTAPPHACIAAVNEPAETTVSASMRAPPRAARRSISSTWRAGCTASSTERSTAGELTRS